jgi:predicted RNA binding protein YcfA (HicA-like mRNA interferase family)
MNSMSSRGVIRLMEQNAWYVAAVAGSHYQFKHPHKPSKVAIPHPSRTLAPQTVRSVFRRARLL